MGTCREKPNLVKIWQSDEYLYCTAAGYVVIRLKLYQACRVLEEV